MRICVTPSYGERFTSFIVFVKCEAFILSYDRRQHIPVGVDVLGDPRRNGLIFLSVLQSEAV